MNNKKESNEIKVKLLENRRIRNKRRNRKTRRKRRKTTMTGRARIIRRGIKR